MYVNTLVNMLMNIIYLLHCHTDVNLQKAELHNRTDDLSSSCSEQQSLNDIPQTSTPDVTIADNAAEGSASVSGMSSLNCTYSSGILSSGSYQASSGSQDDTSRKVIYFFL